MLRYQGSIELVITFRRHRDELPPPFHQPQKMAITRVARVRHQHSVARIHQQCRDQQQGAGRARRDHDATGRDIQPIFRGVELGQGLPQPGNAGDRSVIRMPLGKSRPPRLHDGRGSGEIRLAGSQVNDIAARRRQFRGPGKHLYHVEGLDLRHPPGIPPRSLTTVHVHPQTSLNGVF